VTQAPKTHVLATIKRLVGLKAGEINDSKLLGTVQAAVEAGEDGYLQYVIPTNQGTRIAVKPHVAMAKLVRFVYDVSAVVCCRVLLCAAVCCRVLPCAATVCCRVLLCATVCCRVLLCAAVCCLVLPCAAQASAVAVTSLLRFLQTIAVQLDMDPDALAPVCKFIATVPAYASSDTRQAVQQALQIAGLCKAGDVQLISEPTGGKMWLWLVPRLCVTACA
jgi:hypothetical protein